MLYRSNTLRVLCPVMDIATRSFTLLFAGVKQLVSGREIYGADIKECVKAGQRIRVVVSRP
jgi:hypothetical protein